MKRENTYFADEYANLPEELTVVFDSIKNLKVYSKGNTIYNQGDIPIKFYYIKKGQVKIFFLSPDGLEKTLSILGKGAIFGQAAFFDQMPRVSSSKAMMKSEIIAIDEPLLIEMFRKEPTLALNILTLQARSIRMISNQLTNLTFLSAESRIARIIVQSKMIDKSKNYSLFLTHEEIGNMAGCSRVTVSRTLIKFAKEGLIETKYGKINIVNLEKLEKMSEN